MTVLGCVAPVLLAAVAEGLEAAPGLPRVDLRLQEPAPSIERPRGGVSGDAPLTLRPRVWLASEAADRGSGQDAGQQAGGGGKEGRASSPRPGSLDFDLLGEPAKSEQVDERALRVRRAMLTWHQGVGLEMFALQLATTVVGQLDFNDKFGGANTDKYVQTHAILAYTTVAAFVAAGSLALFAPAPSKQHEGFDRVTLHKLSMFTAAAGMATQVALGLWTQSREGYLNQQTVGTAHLAVGYFTLAAVATGVGALVF